MPKRVIAVEPRQAAIRDYEEPQMNAGHVRVTVDFASPKHGSELVEFRGESPHIHGQYRDEWQAFLPREGAAQSPFDGRWSLGNQWVGTITEVGSDVRGFQTGERVCGYGGIAQVHVVSPHDLLTMPESMSWQSALCYDPAHFALCGVHDGGVSIGDRVAVIGLGAIGQIAAQIARLSGASFVAVIDPLENRRRVALSAGADVAINPDTEDAGLRLKQETGKTGVDVIIETSAAESALQTALRGIAWGGTIAYVGWARPFLGGLDLGREAHFNNANIIFSRAVSEPLRDYPRWTSDRVRETCWKLLADGKIDCENIINPIVPFAEADRAYEEYVDRHPERSVKLGIRFP